MTSRDRAEATEKLTAMLCTSRSTALQLMHACDEVVSRAEDSGILAVVVERVWTGQSDEVARELAKAAQALAAECLRLVETVTAIRTHVEAAGSVPASEIDSEDARARIQSILMAKATLA